MKSRDSQQIPCAVCGDEDHGGKLFSCKTFRRANLEEKKAQVKMAKACTKCLDVHGVDGACTPRFLCRKEECKKGDIPVGCGVHCTGCHARDCEVDPVP